MGVTPDRISFRCRLSISITVSMVQNVPVRPQPALQCTNTGREFSSVSGSSERDDSVGAAEERDTEFDSSTSPNSCAGLAGAPKSGHEA